MCNSHACAHTRTRTHICIHRGGTMAPQLNGHKKKPAPPQCPQLKVSFFQKKPEEINTSLTPALEGRSFVNTCMITPGGWMDGLLGAGGVASGWVRPLLTHPIPNSPKPFWRLGWPHVNWCNHFLWRKLECDETFCGCSTIPFPH